VTSDDTPGGDGAGHSVLLARRHRYTGQLSYYRCWTPGPVPLSRLIAVATARWRIEEDHQLSKQAAGLDSGQVIRWKSWHRWTAICLLAYIYLAVTVAAQRQEDAGSGPDAGLIPVTVPELLRLLRDIVIPPPRRDRPHRQHWSQWRRRHQYRASQAHQRWNAYADATPRLQRTTAAVTVRPVRVPAASVRAWMRRASRRARPRVAGCPAGPGLGAGRPAARLGGGSRLPGPPVALSVPRRRRLQSLTGPKGPWGPGPGLARLAGRIQPAPAAGGICRCGRGGGGGWRLVWPRS